MIAQIELLTQSMHLISSLPFQCVLRCENDPTCNSWSFCNNGEGINECIVSTLTGDQAVGDKVRHDTKCTLLESELSN